MRASSHQAPFPGEFPSTVPHLFMTVPQLINLPRLALQATGLQHDCLHQCSGQPQSYLGSDQERRLALWAFGRCSNLGQHVDLLRV